MNGLGGSYCSPEFKESMKAALNRDKLNKQAEVSPIAGRFTTQGAEQSYKDSVLDSQDLLMLNQMMTGLHNSTQGIGGSYV